MRFKTNPKKPRLPFSDLLLLLGAVLIAGALYVPTSMLVQSSRTKDLHHALALIKERDKPGYEALVATRPELLEADLGAHGVGEVEAAARSIKQFLAERHKPRRLLLESEKDGNKKSSEKNPTSRKVLAEIRPVLTTAFISRFFGTEQFVCYILSIWACLMIAVRWHQIRREERLAAIPVFPDLPVGMVFTPDRSSWLIEQMSPSLTGSRVGRVVERSLMRYQTAREVAAAEAVIQAEADALYNEQDSSLAMVRFAIWAVPSIGFIGTVRGMGMALTRADSPNALTEVVGWLGVAFDSTLIALFLSILIMLLSHRFQREIESFVQKLARKCTDELVHQMYVPTESRTGLY